MNGLPVDVDLRELIEGRVSQLCIAAHQCVIRFESGDRICVECTLVLTEHDGLSTTIRDYVVGGGTLTALIERTVAAATRRTDGGLVLVFNNGSRLDIVNDVKEYESFQLHLGVRVIVA